MSDHDIERFLSSFKSYTKEIAKSKEKSQNYLQATGIYTPKGNLKKAYKYNAPCTARKTT
jgi:hypothetical protein